MVGHTPHSGRLRIGSGESHGSPRSTLKQRPVPSIVAQGESEDNIPTSVAIVIVEGNKEIVKNGQSKQQPPV